MDQHEEARFDPQAARQWLDTLYPGNTPGLIHVSATGNWTGRAFSDFDQAVAYMQTMDTREGVYLRATTLKAPLAPGKRGSEEDSLALPGLWADIDIAGPGHKHQLCDADCTKGHVHITRPLPADEATGRQIITESGLPTPTVWVHSGGGLYPWWLLEEPVVVDDDNRTGLAELSQAWQDVIGRSATALGLHYGTGVGDLARVLRVPGSINRKEGLARACRLIEDGTDAYTIASLRNGLQAAVQRHPAPVRPPSPASATSSSPRLEVVRGPGEISPNDDFEARVGWDDQLLLGGWSITKGFPGSYCEWRRPGKDTEGISATTGFDPGRDRLKVFTDASDFTQGEVYTKPGAYAVLHHGGDHRAATRELARLGYGTPLPSPAEQQRAAIAELLPPGSPGLRHLQSVDGSSALALDEPRPAERSGGELPSPNQPLAVARALVARMTTPRTWWRGDFYRHAGTHWDVVEDTSIENWIYRQTEDATYLWIGAKGESELKAWAPTKRKVSDVAHALGVGALHREGEADTALALANGVLQIRDGKRVLLPHTADRFNLFSLPFAYDAQADCPAWMTFLESVLPDDDQAHEFLGEWFGYVLAGRTDHQKMAALIGERRSGKGTIARILTAMMGQENVAGLDLNLLPGNFGLENLIGKSLAISGDVRWHSRHVGDAVPILLQVIGEDSVTAHRKNRPSWNGRLGTRFMMMSNDTPTFSDRSGALGGRMIYLKFDQSFYGREDVSLTDKLLHELPGVLNWALDGLERLDGRGRFTEPLSGQAEAEAVRRLSDPIGAFLDDWCQIGPEHSISLDSLFLRYKAWCESEGRTKDTTTKEIFSRDLRPKVPGLVTKRERISGKQSRFLYGVGSEASSDTFSRGF
jgi:putative DNA primase/helicase